jgi:hypothetical protein
LGWGIDEPVFVEVKFNVKKSTNSTWKNKTIILEINVKSIMSKK